MSEPFETIRPTSLPSDPFLPLAFRFAVAFGLIVLQLALPVDTVHPAAHENVYLGILLLLFLESAWEAGHFLRTTGKLFSTPSLRWIRANLVLDILLIAVLIAFQGVDQERFATVYIFPVLASAFYLGITEILAVGATAAGAHILSVMLFSAGRIPAFGHSGPNLDLEPSQQFFILGFATLQIFLSVLVVVLIRKHLENLRSTLSRSEATVDQLSALYHRVFESMFSGLITVDMDGRITSANPAAENILLRSLTPGTSLDALGLEDLFPLESLPKEQRFEHEFLMGNGTRRILGGNTAPLRDSEGLQTGHLLLFQDLTDLKALEERTRLNERLAVIGELSSELAHELRNPVASILGCAQILRQSEQPKAMTERVLTILGRESERVSVLISDFLDFTRPRPVVLQSCWFPSLIDDVRASWETDGRSTGMPLHVEPPPEIWVQGDPMCIHQVFTNLLSNGRKALRETAKPSIQMSFRRSGDRLDVAVEDNGCGMHPDQLRTIFLPFSSGFREGTGLGMSLVFQFIQRMGWDIRVESQEGSGTCVRLSIPLAEEPRLVLDEVASDPSNQ